MALAQVIKALTQDPETGRVGKVLDGFGDTLMAFRTPIFNYNAVGATVDLNRILKQEANSGTVTQGAGVLVLNSNTNAAGRADIDTGRRYSALNGQGLLFRSMMRLGTDLIADNTREVGFRDDVENTKVFLEFGPSAMNFRVFLNGVEQGNPVPVSTINPDGNEFFICEVLLTREAAMLYLNKSLVATHSMVGQSTMFLDETVFRAYARTVNAGAVTNRTLEFADLSLWWVGDAAVGPTHMIQFASSGADNQLLRGAGVLERICKTVAGAEQWTLRDGLTASGQAMCTELTCTTLGAMQEINVFFADGLFFDHTGGGGNDTLQLFVRGV